ncbi:MAG: hypothetical protein ACK4ND_19980, partial [Cytophagaceae bacterium]
MKKLRVIKLITFSICTFGFLLFTIDKVLAERFFQTNNTWYEKIPANAKVIDNSNKYVQTIVDNSPLFYVNNGGYSVPVWYAKKDTPIVTVEVRSLVYGPIARNLGWDKVPIPDEALPAMNEESCSGSGPTDGHMVVVSYDRRWAWDFYAARKCDGKWSTHLIRKWDLATDGVLDPCGNLGWARMACVPLLHGLIT